MIFTISLQKKNGTFKFSNVSIISKYSVLSVFLLETISKFIQMIPSTWKQSQQTFVSGNVGNNRNSEVFFFFYIIFPKYLQTNPQLSKKFNSIIKNDVPTNKFYVFDTWDIQKPNYPRVASGLAHLAENKGYLWNLLRNFCGIVQNFLMWPKLCLNFHNFYGKKGYWRFRELIRIFLICRNRIFLWKFSQAYLRTDFRGTVLECYLHRPYQSILHFSSPPVMGRLSAVIQRIRYSIICIILFITFDLRSTLIVAKQTYIPIFKE